MSKLLNLALGILGVAVSSTALLVSPRTVPNCQFTALGDASSCESPAAAQTQVADRRALGLNIADIETAAGLSTTAYETQ